MGKFSLKKACGVGRTTKAPLTTQPPFVRAADITVNKRARAAPRTYKTTLKQNLKQRKMLSAPSATPRADHNNRNKSILSLLLQRSPSSEHAVRQENQEAASEQAISRDLVGDVHAYVEEVKKIIASGGLTGQSPWVSAASPHAEILTINAQRRRANEILLTSKEILNLVLRPDVYVWAPDKLSGEPVRCPACNRLAVASEWNRARILHRVHTHKLYLTMRYACQNCPAIANCSDKPESKNKQARKLSWLMFLKCWRACLCILRYCGTSPTQGR